MHDRVLVSSRAYLERGTHRTDIIDRPRASACAGISLFFGGTKGRSFSAATMTIGRAPSKTYNCPSAVVNGDLPQARSASSATANKTHGIASIAKASPCYYLFSDRPTARLTRAGKRRESDASASGAAGGYAACRPTRPHVYMTPTAPLEDCSPSAAPSTR